MIALLTSRLAMAERMGGQFLDTMREWVTRYTELQAARGRTTGYVAIDDDSAMSAFGLAVAGDRQPSTYVSVVKDVASACRARGETLDAVLILGGDDIVPFWRLANPVRDRNIDPDEAVLSDNPYGLCGDDTNMAPRIPVGRICDSGSAGAFTDSLEHVLDRLATPSRLADSFAAINVAWVAPSVEAEHALGGVVDRRLCPYYTITPDRAGDLSRRMLYFNLHGFDGSAAWSGYDVDTDQFVDAVRPSSFQSRAVAGAMAVTEACYGAQVVDRTPGNSCALAAQREGVAGFIGATGLVFGSFQRPILDVADSDTLAPRILSRLSAGMPAGQALRDGRAAFVSDIGRALNPYEKKTALQYVLLGDPTSTAA